MSEQWQTMRQMPRYQSHKKVWALKIKAIYAVPLAENQEDDGTRKIEPADDGYAMFTTKPGWASRCKATEEDQGYFVQYDDGYTSWSPTKAFEDGYTKVGHHHSECRVVDIGTQEHTQVVCTDNPGAGGACHDYEIHCLHDLNGLCASIHFQNGPIQENGVNGCHNEDLLAIVIDRLQHFQKGEFACRENAIALTNIEQALLWLGKRTADRRRRGVEGKSVV